MVLAFSSNDLDLEIMALRVLGLGLDVLAL